MRRFPENDNSVYMSSPFQKKGIHETVDRAVCGAGCSQGHGSHLCSPVFRGRKDGAGDSDLRDWLESLVVAQVAMKSTGVYWKPVYYLLEEVFTVLLVNAHIKNVPVRKTDVADCAWIAQLLEHGRLGI